MAQYTEICSLPPSGNGAGALQSEARAEFLVPIDASIRALQPPEIRALLGRRLVELF